MDWGDPALITAGVGGVASVGAVVVSALGRKDTRRQQIAADKVAEDKVELEKTQQAVDTYEKLTERLAVQQKREQERADRAESRADRAEKALEKERRDRETDRAAFMLVEDRCRTQTTQLVEAVAVLRATVVSEIAQAAMDKAMGQISPHPHDGSGGGRPDGPAPEIGG